MLLSPFAFASLPTPLFSSLLTLSHFSVLSFFLSCLPPFILSRISSHWPVRAVLVLAIAAFCVHLDLFAGQHVHAVEEGSAQDLGHSQPKCLPRTAAVVPTVSYCSSSSLAANISQLKGTPCRLPGAPDASRADAAPRRHLWRFRGMLRRSPKTCRIALSTKKFGKPPSHAARRTKKAMRSSKSQSRRTAVSKSRRVASSYLPRRPGGIVWKMPVSRDALFSSSVN